MADWIMIGITTIYVIATVIMCLFNYKALVLTKQQLLETIRRHNEQQRSNSMPILQVKLVDSNTKSNGFDYVRLFNDVVDGDTPIRNTMCFSIANVGYGIAQKVSYYWDNGKHSSKPEIYSLPVNDCRILNIEFIASSMLKNEGSPSAVIRFTDIHDIEYEQKLYFHLSFSEKTINLINISITAPKAI